MSVLASAVDLPDPTVADLISARPQFSMHAMDGLLLDGVPLNAVADALGTPVWVYSAATMRARYAAFTSALQEASLECHIHYAVKANDLLAVLRVLANAGAGADVVSEGELMRAREAGISADRIVFSGVGKSTGELRLALAEDIAQINVESGEELEMLSAIAAGMGQAARIALRINPDIDAGTHSKITHRPRARQVRNPVRRCRFVICPRKRTARHPAGRLGGAYRQPDWLDRAVSRAYGRLAALVRELRGAGHSVTHRGLRRRTRHRVPQSTYCQPDGPGGRVARCVQGSGRQADCRTRTMAGRTGRRVARLCAAGQECRAPVRGARRRHERPAPSRVV